MVEILEQLPSETVEFSREALVRLLRSIANSEPDVRSKKDLKIFLAEQQVLEIFSRAIDEFGEAEDWIGDLSTGKLSNHGRFISASFLKPPVLNGGSILHIYGYEGDDPSFGLLLPFDKYGLLDDSREVSASSFMNKKVFYIRPNEHKLFETRTKAIAQEEEEICATITWVTQLAAAHLASSFEGEVHLSLYDELAV